MVRQRPSKVFGLVRNTCISGVLFFALLVPLQTHASGEGIFSTIFCGVTSWFGFVADSCNVQDLPETLPDTATPTPDTSQVSVVSDVPQTASSAPQLVSPTSAVTPVTYVTNDYTTNPVTIIREAGTTTIIREQSSGSSGVSSNSFSRQVDAIYESLSQNVSAVLKVIGEAITTATLTVTGNTSVGGSFSVSGVSTSTFSNGIDISEGCFAVDGVCLSSGGGGGGADTALSNLASVAINTTLVSDTDNLDDLGTSAVGWRTGYFDTSVRSPLILGGSGTTQDLSLQTTSGIGATGADMHFLVGSNGGTEAMTILNNGNVGIGTTDPETILDISDSDDAGLTLRAAGTTDEAYTNYFVAGVQIGTLEAFGSLWVTPERQNALALTSHVNNSGKVIFTTRTAGQYLDRMVISNAGNVGIGTTSPYAKLSVVGQVAAEYFTATSTTATSTFHGAMIVGTDSLKSGSIQLNSVTSADKAFTLANGYWWDNAVGYLRPTTPNSKIAFDLMPNGTAAETHMDICSDDVYADANNWECLELIKNDNSYAHIGTKALGTGGVRDLLINQYGGNVNVGYSATGSLNGMLALRAYNPSGGSAAFTSIGAHNGLDDDDSARILALGSNWSASGGFKQDSGAIDVGANLSGGLSIISRHTSGEIRFYTGGFADGNERMRIRSNGNVGVATTTPWRTFSVTGTVGFDGLTAATGAGSLCLDANKQVVYNSASDACLSSTRDTKHDIEGLTLQSLDLISQLEPVSFVYNEGDDRTRYGFIAEDTAVVAGSLVTYDMEDEITGIDDRAILSLVVHGVKDLWNQVQEYFARTEQLENRVSELEARIAELEGGVPPPVSTPPVDSEIEISKEEQDVSEEIEESDESIDTPVVEESDTTANEDVSQTEEPETTDEVVDTTTPVAPEETTTPAAVEAAPEDNS